MPDLIAVLTKWWKLIFGLSLVAALIAFVASLVSPKKYLSTATALPANSVIADKARLLNTNIEALYSDFGTADELDKLEGTANLDTIFIAAAQEFNLYEHYKIEPSDESTYKAVLKLKKNSRISRTAYSELKAAVWDEDRNLAAALANSLLKNLGELHQHLQNENNITILKKLKESYQLKEQQYKKINDSAVAGSRSETEILHAKKNGLLEQMQQYEKAIDQYQLAVNTSPQVLLIVEPARPSVWSDKPKVLQTVLFALGASLACTFLMALSMENKTKP